jgi:hypothetical protein
MIITKLQGGVGNQLFQYACGRSASSKYLTKQYLDTRFYKSQSKRTFDLGKFTNANIDTNLDMIQANYPIIRIGDSFIYTPITNPVDCNYYLDGYWQSEKYFIESENIIREDLSPSKEMIDFLQRTPYLNSNSLSIHVRRTDYLESNGYHPVQTIEYYKNAVDVIGEYDKIFVFADDINWCKENFKFKNMIFMEGFTDIQDLYLMSYCKNNIIANSSFSWWGAWLNKNINKKVISPRSWFGSHVELSDLDIIPQKWTRI